MPLASNNHKAGMRGPLFGKTVVVTRSRDQAAGFAKMFAEQGASVIEFPTIEIVPPASWAELDEALDAMEAFHWIIFTSTNAVTFFMKRLQDIGKDSQLLTGIRICAVGPKTAEAIGSFSLKADLVPDEFKAEGVLASLAKEEIKGRRFLIPRAKEAREIIPDALRKLGADVTVATVYENVKPIADAKRVKGLFEQKRIDVATFTSPSTVRNFVEMMGQKEYKTLLNGVAIACIGPITAKAAEEQGIQADIIPKDHTISALVNAVVEYFKT